MATNYDDIFAIADTVTLPVTAPAKTDYSDIFAIADTVAIPTKTEPQNNYDDIFQLADTVSVPKTLPKKEIGMGDLREEEAKSISKPFNIGDEEPLEIKGNIDLYNRLQVKNPNGSISTVLSKSFNIGGKEVLLPTINDDGKKLDDKQTIDLYKKTGKYLGKFDTIEEANIYAEKLHQDQEKFYQKPKMHPIGELARKTVDVINDEPTLSGIVDKSIAQGMTELPANLITIAKYAGVPEKILKTKPLEAVQRFNKMAEFTPEEQQYIETHGIPAKLATGAANMAGQLPSFMATGGIAGKIVGKVLIKGLAKRLATDAATFGALQATGGAATAMEEEKTPYEILKETVKEGGKGAGTGAVLGVAGKFGKIASAGVGGGLAAVEGGGADDVIANAILFGVMGKKEKIPESTKAAEIFKGNPSRKNLNALKDAVNKEQIQEILPKEKIEVPKEIIDPEYMAEQKIAKTKDPSHILEIKENLELKQDDLFRGIAYREVVTDNTMRKMTELNIPGSVMRMDIDNMAGFNTKNKGIKAKADEEMRATVGQFILQKIKNIGGIVSRRTGADELTAIFPNMDKSEIDKMVEGWRSELLPELQKRGLDKLSYKTKDKGDLLSNYGAGDISYGVAEFKPGKYQETIIEADGIAEAMKNGKIARAREANKLSKINNNVDITNKNIILGNEEVQDVAGSKKSQIGNPPEPTSGGSPDNVIKESIPVGTAGGTGAVKPVEVPASTPEVKERAFPKTVEKETGFPASELSAEDKLYNVLHHEETIKRADNEIAKRGVEGAYNWIKEEEGLSPEKLVAGEKLITNLSDQAIKETDPALKQKYHEKVKDLIGSIAPQLTTRGQTIEAVKILGKLEPEAIQFTFGKELIKGGKKINEFTLETATKLKELAQKLEVAKTPQEKSDVMREIYKEFEKTLPPATKMEKFQEAWRNSILSSFATQTANIISNSLNMALVRPAERTLAGVISHVSGKGDIPITEGVSLMAGMAKAIPDAARNFLKTFQSEISSEGLTGMKTELPKTKGAIEGAKGKAIRIPQRFLTAADDFSKTIIRDSNITAYAYRQAHKEKLTGEAFTNRVEKLINKPTKDMVDLSNKEAAYRTFNEPLGKFGEKISHLRRDMPALYFVYPFLRTPVNIAKYTLERTPGFGQVIFAKRLKQGYFKEGTATEQQNKIIESISSQIIGAGLASATVLATAQGFITGGGPKDQRKRKELYATGWLPYAVKVGDHYYSYSRLEPMASIVGMAADFVELSKESKKQGEINLAADKIAYSFAKNISNKTMMQGLTNILNAYSDPERYGKNWLQRTAGSLFPSFLAQGVTATDEYYREINSIEDVMKSKIVGLSKELPPKRDVFGEPIKKEGSAFYKLVVPLQYSTRKKDNEKIVNALIDAEVSINEPGKTLNEVEMNPKVYDDYKRIIGNIRYKKLKRITDNPAFDKNQDDKKEDKLNKAIRESRDEALTFLKNKYKDQYPELFYKKQAEAYLKKIGK